MQDQGTVLLAALFGSAQPKGSAVGGVLDTFLLGFLQRNGFYEDALPLIASPGAAEPNYDR
jgi:hypothetical protein